MARDSGEVRYIVAHRTTTETCVKVVASFAPSWASVLYTDDLRGYVAVWDELNICHSSVKHSWEGERPHEWARDDDGDGIREVHCNSCEGAGAGLRTYLRMFRGVHKKYLSRYVAVYEAMTNAKRITAAIIQRMCLGLRALQPDYT